MEASFWLQVFIAVLSTVFAAIIIAILTSFYKQWRIADRRREILHIKVECIAEGLRRMNGDTSLKFGKVYDEELQRKMDEFDLITK